VNELFTNGVTNSLSQYLISDLSLRLRDEKITLDSVFLIPFAKDLMATAMALNFIDDSSFEKKVTPYGLDGFGRSGVIFIKKTSIEFLVTYTNMTPYYIPEDISRIGPEAVRPFDFNAKVGKVYADFLRDVDAFLGEIDGFEEIFPKNFCFTIQDD
jgi:hypothetical protein